LPARRALLLALLPALLACGLPATALASEAVWKSLREGGLVVLLRHSLTVPGVGDPPSFKLDDCSTQRLLSESGRAQARRLGAAFRSRDIPVGAVLSSRWCRCLDTASLAFEKVEPWPVIDSFFDAYARGLPANARGRQTAALRERIASHRGRDNLVLVTHQVNITAVSDLYPAMDEMLVLRPATADEAFVVVGRLTIP